MNCAELYSLLRNHKIHFRVEGLTIEQGEDNEIN